jgi:hypothetical protein
MVKRQIINGIDILRNILAEEQKIVDDYSGFVMTGNISLIGGILLSLVLFFSNISGSVLVVGLVLDAVFYLLTVFNYGCIFYIRNLNNELEREYELTLTHN